MRTIEITERADGSWDIVEFKNDSIFPTTIKNNAYECIARVAQLLNIKEPVIPQNYPEKVCIGEVE